MSKKIISFSLWGANKKYTIGAIKNVELANKFYPGWTCRFYCANNVPEDIIKNLRDNSEVIILNENPDWKFPAKRFLVMAEPDLDRVIFRDTDSRIPEREVKAVNEWIESGKFLHIMKDHPYHGGFPILAGMFGVVGGLFDHIEKLLEIANDIPEQYHFDQIFLQKYIWSVLQNNCMIHDEFFLKKPFPTKRNNFEFVGQVFDENDISVQEHTEILKRYLNK